MTRMTQPKTVTRDELLDALDGGAVVVTANARLSRTLAAGYERRMLAGGHEAWATPEVLPLSAWWLQQYREAALYSGDPLPRLLDQEQEEQVWAAIIRADEGRLPQALLRLDATARRAREAWKLLCEWHLDLDDHRFEDNENGSAFRRWARRFRQECERREFIPAAEIPSALAPLIARRDLPLPDRMLLTGFFELTPATRSLTEALGKAGCAVSHVERAGIEAPARRFTASDAWSEMTAAADWARALLSDSPEARIGIVVPDLAARRPALAHLLGKALDPQSLRPGGTAARRPWNLSLGGSLAEAPVVRTALRMLSLSTPPVRLELAGVLLTSPHWALPRDGAERMDELSRRALLDRRLRTVGDAEITLSALKFRADQLREDGTPQPWRCAGLARRLDEMQQLSRDWPDSQDPQAWAAAFTDWLSRAGWPEGRPLDSGEYQAVEAWNELLSVFSGLGDFTGSLSRQQALGLLERLAEDTVFQPRAADTPVQVLGLYEASGQEFDHLWVMGLHEGAWPPATGPDPFLPLGLQRERGVPHSEPALELEWARRVTGELRAAAAEVIFSYPARDGSEEQFCSPLIADLPEVAAEDLPRAPDAAWAESVRAEGGLEPAPEQAPIPLLQTEVAGGSRVLACQSTCPFRAFAEHRLGARPLERPTAGLGAKRSGTLVHRVLERFWREVESHARLVELDTEALRETVRVAVDSVLEEQRRRSPLTVSPRFAEIEAARLEQRIMDWLDVERGRPPFRAVGFEERRQLDIGGLGLQVFVDRVDELEDGSRVVLDYKTGKVSPVHWFGERPDDPQLPLYGVACRRDGELAGVAFAEIRANGMAFNGVVRDADVLPGLPASRSRALKDAAEQWPAVLDEWSEVLERLAGDFAAGEARVDPNRGLNTCRAHYCELAPLCRIREALGADAAESEEIEGDG
ncbi:MAG: PD-(D/E)XK nuclease family protein [Lysobacterales bacterium]|jgi:probable DNA repair protein